MAPEEERRQTLKMRVCRVKDSGLCHSEYQALTEKIPALTWEEMDNG